MASPFPGMDPYLEQPAFWPSFHNRLMVAIATELAPILRPQYYIEVETRVYTDLFDGELLIGIPDAIVLGESQASVATPQNDAASRTAVALRNPPSTVTLPMPTEIKERYLEVREVGSNRVITAIELLSPTNKRKGKGREIYEAKRLSLLGSDANFIEMDLLRGNLAFPIGRADEANSYYVLVSRTAERPRANLYNFTLRDSLPEFLLPLAKVDESIVVDLQKIFETVVEQASYDLRIDYTQSLPKPALSPVDQSWVENVIKERENK